MSADRFKRMRSLFQQALPLGPGERDDLLREACGDDAALRAEVESLLAHDRDAATGFLDSGRSASPDTAPRFDKTMSANAPTEDRAAATDPARLTLPDYELLVSIGRGGFGEVWLARQKLTDVLYAIKLVRSGRIGQTELASVRIYKQNTGVHPHLVHLEHVGEVAGYFYYAMELADDARGPSPRLPTNYRPMTLSKLPRPASPGDATEVISQVISGVAHLHNIGLLHRDIKPDNVIRCDERWKLCDIGLVVANDAIDSAACSPAYAPPETVVDRSGDLFSLGVMFRDLLLPPRPKQQAGRFDPTFPTIAADIPVSPAVTAAIQRACCLQPEGRYQSAQELLASIKPRASGSLAATTAAPPPELSILIADHDELARDTPCRALENRRLQVAGLAASLSAVRALVARVADDIHAIYFNPFLGRSLTDSITFVSEVRESYPHIVFVLFVNEQRWLESMADMPRIWQQRFAHYFRVNRNASLESIDHEIEASLEGIRFDVRRTATIQRH